MPRGDGRLSHDLDPQRSRPAGRLRRLRRLGARRRGREAHLLRAVRAAAPRPGGGRHRGQRRLRRGGLQGPRPGRPGLRRADPGQPARPHRDRPHPLLHHRRLQLGERAADAARPSDQRRRHHDRAGPQRQPGQHRRAGPRRSPSSACDGRRLHLRHRAGDDAAGRPAPTCRSRPRRWRCCRRLRGAFSFVFMDEDTLYAARDPQGVRPLVLGRLERGWVVASETAALDIVGASFVREVEPGELLAIDEHGLRSQPVRRARTRRAACSSTSTWPARTPPSPAATCTRPGSRSAAGWPRSTRSRPTWSSRCPESGTPAAIGYAEESGIPYGAGLVKNAYVGRTFIQPSQTIRQLGIRLKLNPLREVVRGKRLVVVDDSIVRGNTQRAHGPDAARGRRDRGARADLLAAGASGRASTASTSPPGPS